MAKATHTGTCAICGRTGLKVSKKGEVANHGHQKNKRMSECYGGGYQALELGPKAFIAVAEYWERDEAEKARLIQSAKNWEPNGELREI